MLDPAIHTQLAQELHQAEATRVQVEHFSKRHPETTIDDSYAIQREWVPLQTLGCEYRKKPWEAFGAHYLQMLGAMGGAQCRSKGEPLSAYENAQGTGSIHVWFQP